MTRIVVLRPDEELRITGQKQSGSRPPQFYSLAPCNTWALVVLTNV
jgi:hypothetical protein